MINPTHIQLIEDYYEGSLSASDRALFKQLMKDNADFRAEAKAYKKVFSGLGGLHLNHLQNQMNAWEQNFKSSSQEETVKETKIVSMSPFRRYISIAAAVALLLAVPLVYQSIVPGDPYEQHFHASDPTAFAIHAVAVRDSKSLSQYERVKGDALAAYRNKDYVKTIEQLNNLKNNFTKFADKDSQLFLILGASQMVQEDFAKAADNLAQVFNFPDAADNKKEAEWLWALSQYKLGNINAAKEMLQKIQNYKRHSHQTAAKAFLDSIS